MGPFPHDAPTSEISAANPIGTDGFEFVEFAHPDPQELRDLFATMGYQHTATHKTKDIELWQQGDITYVLNAQTDGFAAKFAAEHGPCAASMASVVLCLLMRLSPTSSDIVPLDASRRAGCQLNQPLSSPRRLGRVRAQGGRGVRLRELTLRHGGV